MLSIEEIKALSEEERSAYNRKLIMKIVTQLVALHTLKWVVIIGGTRALRKALEKNDPEN